MANGHGGKRTPAHPAPVSGPGKYSRRTDGGPAQALSAPNNLPYGEKQQLLNEQRIAPMGGKQPLPNIPAPQAGPGEQAPQSMQPFTGASFGAPSQRPNEPITAGVDAGPGPGPEALNLPQQPTVGVGTGRMTALLQGLSATDTTGILGQLMQAAQARNA